MKLERFYSYFYALKSIKKLDSKLEKDGWVINNDLDLSYLNLYFFPAIKRVSGDFYCHSNQLTTLQGAPQEVGGCFYCDYNKLTTLQWAPQKVGGSFSCSNNKLTTLQGAPKEIGGNFICSNNPIAHYYGLNKIKVCGKIYK